MNDMVSLVSLGLLSFTASALSATTGMGGIFLLAGMYALMNDLAIVLPIHATVSMASNFTRLLTYYKHVHYKAYRFFMIGSIPGLFLGALFLNWLLPIRMQVAPYMMMFIGAFIILSATNKSRTTVSDPPLSSFIALGMYAAPISLIFGANGAIISPHLIRNDMSRQQIVATSTACQLSIHLLKIIIFAFLWRQNQSTSNLVVFQSESTLVLVTVMVVMALLGTLFGKIFTERIKERTFKRIFVATIYAIGGKFIFYDGLYKLFARRGT